MAQLYVGVGRANITPPMGMLLQGYTPPRPCTSVHDPVQLTVFAFSWEDKKAILASADLCNLRGPASEDVRKALARGANVPYEYCMIACTHTHSGPHTLYKEPESAWYVREMLCPWAEQAAAAAQ